MGDTSVKVSNNAAGDRPIDNESITGHPDGIAYRQRVEIAGAALAEVARVQATAPVGIEQALVVRPIPSGTQTVSGTVTAAQGTAAAASGAWPTKISDGTDTVGISTVGGAKALKADVMQTVGPLAAQLPATLDSGNLRVAIEAAPTLAVSGTVTANIGTAPTLDVSQTDVATADYQTGGGTTQQAMMGIALPSPSGPVAGGTATDPVRVDPTGSTTQPVSGTVFVEQSNGDNLNVRAVGREAHDDPATANPVLVAGRGSAAVPTVVSADGDVTMLWLNQHGAAKVAIVDDVGDSCMDGANNALKVSVVSGAAGGTASDDRSSFVDGVTAQTPIGGIYNDAITDAASGETAAARITAARSLHVTLRDEAGDSAMDGANNALRVNVVAGGAGDGSILDGVDTGIKATVLDYAASNPLAVRLTDTNGDYVGAGAGTQYTEDAAAAADPTGTMLIARRRDSLSGETTTDGDNTALNSTAKGELYVKHVDALPVTDNGSSLTVDNPALAVTGGGVEASALRVTIASDSTGLVSVDDGGSSLSVDDNGSSLTIDNPALSVVGGGTEASALRVTLASDSTGLLSVDDNGSSLTVDSAQLPAALVGGRLDVVVGAALPAGSNAIGQVQITDGSDVALVTAGGLLQVDASGATVPVSDAGGSLTVDNAALSVTGGGVEASALRVTIASDSTGVLSVDDNGASLTIDNAALAVVGGGTEASALRVTIASDSTGVVSVDDNGSSLTVDGTVTANAGTGNFTVVQATASSLNAQVVGAAAHGAPVAGNPVLVGAYASETAPSEVTAGDAVQLWADTAGRLKTMVQARSGGDFFPTPIHHRPDLGLEEAGEVRLDNEANLCIRGPVLTDEGNLKDDFTGTSLTTNLTGTPSFTTNSTSVTGSGTAFTTELSRDHYIRISAHSETTSARVNRVLSDTELELTTAYTGATTSGTTVKAYHRTVTGSGGSFSVGTSKVTIASGTTSGSLTELIREVDYGPLICTWVASVSQRVANQEGFIGLQDAQSSANMRALVVFSGATNTTVIFRTSYTSSANDTQETTVTLPGGITSATDAYYKIELFSDHVRLLVNDVILASHKLHIPAPYTVMYAVAGWNNTGVPGSSSNLLVDVFDASNLNLLQTTQHSTLAVGGDAAHDETDYGNPVKVGGKAAVAALPTAVANNDRANLAMDRYGRALVTEVDHGLLSWKAATYTTTQTGTALWTPAGGKVIVVTGYTVATFGTTAGRVTLWFGAGGDTAYTEGTDKPVFDGNFAPSANSAPGTNVGTCRIPADAADRVLRVTTDANISVRVQVFGYEITP